MSEDAQGLTVRGLCAGYGPTRIVEDVTLSVEPQQALAVFGRNGAGKTTVINAIAGRIPLQAGSIHFGGHRLELLRPSERCRLGLALVPQDRQIFTSLTVEENLQVANRGRADAIESAYALFPRLADRRHVQGDRISGGEQQMLAIARALLGRPRCLLLDEPFEGLAPVIVDELLAVLHTLRTGGPAMIVVEHHARLLIDVVDAAVVMERGRVRLEGDRMALLAAWNDVEALLALPDEE